MSDHPWIKRGPYQGLEHTGMPIPDGNEQVWEDLRSDGGLPEAQAARSDPSPLHPAQATAPDPWDEIINDIYDSDGSGMVVLSTRVRNALAAERAKHQEISDSYRAEIARLSAIIAERKEC